MTKKIRSCITCGEQTAKADLLRVVRTSEGAVFFDPTGRAAGRGAYLCSPRCFAAARKTRKLDRALRTRVSDEDYLIIDAELARAGDDGAEETEE